MPDVYVRLGYGKVAKTIEIARHGQTLGDYAIDLDAAGHVIGIEVLGAESVEIDGEDVTDGSRPG